jgi:hypothetical protein
VAERSCDLSATFSGAPGRLPELYTRGVLGTDDSRQLDEEAVAALAAALRNRLHARQVVETLTTEIPGYIVGPPVRFV